MGQPGASPGWQAYPRLSRVPLGQAGRLPGVPGRPGPRPPGSAGGGPSSPPSACVGGSASPGGGGPGASHLPPRRVGWGGSARWGGGAGGAPCARLVQSRAGPKSRLSQVERWSWCISRGEPPEGVCWPSLQVWPGAGLAGWGCMIRSASGARVHLLGGAGGSSMSTAWNLGELRCHGRAWRGSRSLAGAPAV